MSLLGKMMNNSISSTSLRVADAAYWNAENVTLRLSGQANAASAAANGADRAADADADVCVSPGAAASANQQPDGGTGGVVGAAGVENEENAGSAGSADEVEAGAPPGFKWVVLAVRLACAQSWPATPFL